MLKIFFSNNFEDFWSSLVLLWDLLVVNNWHIFLHEFGESISGWTQVIFHMTTTHRSIQ